MQEPQQGGYGGDVRTPVPTEKKTRTDSAEAQVEASGMTEAELKAVNATGLTVDQLAAADAGTLQELFAEAKFNAKEKILVQSAIKKYNETQTKPPGHGTKRSLEEEPYCFSPKAAKKHKGEVKEGKDDESTESEAAVRPVLAKLEKYEDVLRISYPDESNFILFGIQQYHKTVKDWVSHLFKPTSSSQRKQLLLVHGAVKSGKTTLIKDALAYLLVQLQSEMDEFKGKTFCFAYIDLSALANLTSTEAKWETFWYLLEKAFPDRMFVDRAKVGRWHVEVQKSLVALKDHGAALWFISLDEFHNLFSGLDKDQVANMAETAKHIFLDNDSPCYFLLGGSTQATFWSAVGKAKDNGLRILHEAHVLTTPFQASDEEMKECRAALVEQGVGSEESVNGAFDVLPPSQRTCVNLTQVVLRASTTSVGKAYESFILAKQSVFKKDYMELPDPEMLERILNWANGSAAQPPSLYAHLLRKEGELYYIQDQDFRTFLAQFYDRDAKRIKLSGDVLPVTDILLFVPLIPVGQLQNESKMNDEKFEADAYAFAAAEFDAAHWEEFAKFLVDGPDPANKEDKTVNPNFAYPAKHPNPHETLTWVLVVRLLRNIFSHQKDVKWSGLATVKEQVLRYMKSPLTFTRFIRCYEACRT